MALEKAGIPFSMGGVAGELLRSVRGEGEITFEPLGGVGSSIGSPTRRFPQPGEDGITAGMIEALANATRWRPLKRAMPMSTILQEDRD